jgi:hypothetical protein
MSLIDEPMMQAPEVQCRTYMSIDAHNGFFDTVDVGVRTDRVTGETVSVIQTGWSAAGNTYKQMLHSGESCSAG